MSGDVDRRRFLEALVSMGAYSLGGCSSSDTKPAPAPTPEPVPLSKAPWTQTIGARAVRLRFETREEVAVPVKVTTEGGSLDLTPALTTRDISYVRDFIQGDPNYFPDEAGLHTLQEVVIDDLEPGVTYEYAIGAEGSVVGRFRAPPAVGTSCRVGWLADTSWPLSADSVAVLAAAEPDLFLHGGDLQYQSSPLDTWNGMIHAFEPLMSRALAHLVVGNHEFEDNDEIDQMYDRLYGGQGDENDTTRRYFAMSFGGVRWIGLDTETGDLATDAAQLSWLEQQLAAAASSGDIAQTVVAFHRPVYTLSKHFPSSTATRDLLHPLFAQYGVRLVMMGHAHCYERFLVDGIHYVVDGGGGSLLYDPNESLEEADMLRPGESDLRVAVDESRGATILEVGPDGSLSVERFSTDGAQTDAFDVSVS
jgi:Calcineurin-like phosphoesterase